MMDWDAVAHALAERSAQPIVLLDHTGRVALINQAMERALGWTRAQVDGQLWTSAYAPGADAGWIAEALRGALRAHDEIVSSASGVRMVLSLELTLVGSAPERGLIGLVLDARPVEATTGQLETQDLEYEVSLPGHHVTRLSTARGPVPLALREPCWAVIHGRAARCEACPLAADDAEPWPRISARYRARQAGTVLELKTAEKLDGARTLVRHRLLPDRALDALHAAKVETLAARAKLTARERELLTFLLLGRGIDEIAEQLGITPRTVKFHQTNVLEKLGADSRVDLARVLF